MRIAFVASVVIAMSCLASCTSTTEECDCAYGNGLTILASQGAVASITVSGVACADASFGCLPSDPTLAFTPGCTEIFVLPQRAGDCRVDVVFTDGSHHPIDVTMIDTRGSGCCGTVHPDGPPGAEIVDLRSDAGATDAATDADVAD